MGAILPQSGYSGLAEIWGDFIDWEKRRKGEGGFLKRIFTEASCKTVFDASLGDGCDSIYLIKEGFDVISNGLDKDFIKKAKENAEREKVNLKITSYNWLELDSKVQAECYDAVICVGNSFTHLFTKTDQMLALKGFRHILRAGGTLIIDQRNYQYILDNRDEILAGKFRYSGNVMYCGQKVLGFPVAIEDKKVVFEYSDSSRNISGRLELYPFRRGEMVSLLKDAGFSEIEEYSDYKPGFDPEADFYTYVCRK